ncbi:MAG: AAA family ATPase [Verrucomicrobia bacterium]|nr:AAA family ATPase [Verrucomicrobiota bacterium]
MPRCLIIAGPNGAGKTTFARRYLPKLGILTFINADYLASGLSPLKPSAAQVAAGKLFLRELDRLAAAQTDFCFESTLSGLTYVARLTEWKSQGYDLEIIYLRLPSVRISLQRVAARVKTGGHDIPEADVRRRFARSWQNFQTVYSPLAVRTWTYDVGGPEPVFITNSP